MPRNLLRHVRLDGGYDLRTYELVPIRRASTGQELIGYEFRDPRGEVLFAGEDYGVSPLHAIDSDEALRGLLLFLTLCPGDTDPDYFDHYTDAQLAFARSDAEALSLYAIDPEPGEEALPFEDVED